MQNDGIELSLAELKAQTLSLLWAEHGKQVVQSQPMILLDLNAYEEAAAGHRIYLAPFPERHRHRPAFAMLCGRELEEATASIATSQPFLRPELPRSRIQTILEFTPKTERTDGFVSGTIGVVVNAALSSAVVTTAWAGLTILGR